MFSASLRQGITTETRAPSGAGARRPGEAVSVWRRAHGSSRGRIAATCQRTPAMEVAAKRRSGGAWRADGSGRACEMRAGPMRICLVYDCLFPYTVGGAERWYRNLAERARRGGPRGHLPDAAPVGRADEPPELPGVRVVGGRPRGALHRGRPPPHRAAAALRAGVLCAPAAPRPRLRRRPHLLVPLLLAARRARGARRPADARRSTGSRSGARLLARVPRARRRARSAHAVQRAVRRLPQQAFCFSDLHAARLREEGLRGEPCGARGPVRRPDRRARPRSTRRPPPLVVFAGRLIPEKRRRLVPAAVAAARRTLPELRGLILGDGPERPARARRDRARSACEDVVDAPGLRRRRRGRRRRSAARPACCCPPRARATAWSSIEAAARGTPSVVVAGEDNAAVELIERGRQRLRRRAGSGRGRRGDRGGAPRRRRRSRERTAAWFDEQRRGALGDARRRARVAERYASARS